MRLVLILVVVMLSGEAVAQTKLPTQDQVLQRTREGFKNAKTKEAREGVRMWCTDSIRALDFRDRDRLMVEALKLMEADKLAEANERLKKVGEMEELADNLAKLVCKPERY